MEAHLLEWVNLAIRWLHIIAGIAWIGSSFFFMWLDSHLEPGETPKEDIEGELWMVHSGGFYQVEKFKVAPTKMPKTLHWFKWEAAVTWISGISLLLVAFYLTGRGVFLIDGSSPVSAPIAMGIGIATLVVGWLVYDGIYRSPLGKTGNLAAAISFVLLVVAAYFLSEIFSGRAAYIHVGALMGTIMAFNVWAVIIPSQQNLVNATLAGKPRDLSMGPKAKQRSVHNNYMTLPVIFIMVSGHYPSTFGHEMNWLVLIGLAIVGATTRHYFNLRNAGAGFKGWTWGVSVAGMAALIVYTAPAMLQGEADDAPRVTYAQIQPIVAERCTVCHSATPTQAGFSVAPLGVVFDQPQDIQAMADRIKVLSVTTQAMPLGNLTSMTEEERRLVGNWIDAGAKIEQ